MRNPARTFRSTSHTLALEQRLLFDGAAMVAAQEVHSADQDSSSADSEHQPAAEAARDASQDHAALGVQTSATSQSVALIDSRLANQAELAQQLQAQGVQVHIVQSGESGLAAICDALAAAQNVSELRVYSHLEHGNQLLGDNAVNQSELQALATADSHWNYYLNDSSKINVFNDTALVESDITAPVGREFVFVSDNLSNWEQLVGDLPSNVYIVILDANKDGVEQIAAALANQSNVSAVHIVAHGSPAELQLGTARLNTQSMQSAYLDELAIIGKALTADGDILVYGCNFAQGDAGLQAAMVLGGITGADIAASNNATGAAALGGDWDLEVHEGRVETREVLTATSAANFAGLLAVPVDGGESLTVEINQTLSVPVSTGLLANASDASGHTLTITGYTVAGIAGTRPVGSAYTIAGRGSITINADGSLTFAPVNNYAGAVPNITYTVSDGQGNSTTSTLQLTVGGVNDAPVNTLPATGWTTFEDVSVSLSGPSAGLSVSDIDAGTTLISVELKVATGTITTSGNVTGGTVSGSGSTTVTLTGTVANINTYLATANRLTYVPAANANGLVTLTMTTNDNGGTGSGGAQIDVDTATITVTARNDPPTGTNTTLAAIEDTPFVLTEANFGFSDPVEGNAFAGVVIVALPPAAQGRLTLNGVAVLAGDFVTAADIAAGSLAFQGASNFNSAAATGAFTFRVRDDGGTANGGTDTAAATNTLNFTIAAVNDAPVNTLPATGWTTFEDVSVSLSGPSAGLSVSDIDAGTTLISVELKVATGTITTSGNVTGGTVSGSGSTTVTLTGTVTNINTYLATANRLTYVPAANANGTVTLTMTTNDNGGIGSGGAQIDVDTATITVTARNDPPTGTNATLAAIEDTPLVLTEANFGFSDPVEGNAFAGVVIVTLPPAAQGRLTLNGVAVLAGDFVTAADIAAGSLAFQGASNFNSAAATGAFTFRVRDDGGTANGGTDTAAATNTLNFTIAAVNDAPVNTLPAAGWTTLEDTMVRLSGISVADVDSGTASITVTLTISSGIFSVFNGDGSYNGATITGTNTKTITITGTAANISALLAFNASTNLSVGRLNVVPDLNAVAPITVTMTTNDNGNTGSGGPLTDVDTALITLTPRNDAPSGADKTVQVAGPGSVYTFSVADFGYSDTDDTPSNNFKELIVVSLPTTGQLRLNGVLVTAGQVISVANLPGLTYTAGATNGLFTGMTFRVVDDGAVGPYDENTDPTPNRIRVRVGPVPDIATDDGNSGLEDAGSVTGSVLSNDAPRSGGTLSILKFSVAGDSTVYTAGQTATIAGVGTLTLNSNGSYTFTPAANYNGDIPQVTYTVGESANVSVFGTGKSDTNTNLAQGVEDPHWTLVSGPPGAVQPVVRSHPWFGSQAISSDNTPVTGTTQPVGNYVFESDFYIPLGTDISTSAMSFAAGGDDFGSITVLVNGVALVRGPGYSVGGPAAMYNWSFPVGVNPLQTGTNVIQVIISNTTTQQSMYVDSFAVSYKDTDTGTLDIKIQSVNDAPAGTDKTVTINEDAVYTFASGDFGFTDLLDNPANNFLNVKITTLPPAGDGILKLDGIAVTAGQFIAVADISKLTFTPAQDRNGMGIGSFTFQVKDDGGTANGGQDTDQSPNTFKFNINPVADPASVTDDARDVTEDLNVSPSGQLSVNGAVTIADPDTGEASFDTNTLAFGTTTAIGGAQLGAVAVNADGTYTYTVSNAAVQYLKAGETIIETYTVQSLDGTGTSTITITIHGVNDVPAVTDDAQSVTEDLGVVGGNLSVGGAVTITDTDTGEASFDTNTLAFGTTTAIGGAQLGAVAVNADGTYTYTVSNAAVQYLKAGETIIETYTVQSLDGTGTSTITITIHGVNDVPAVTDDAQSVTEDLGVVGGNLSVGGAVTITDTDTGEASFDTNTLAFGTTTAIGGAQLGAVAVNADGTYTYTVSNAAVQYLKAGETIIETYTVQSLDGTGTSTITITIHGVNDVPAVTDDAQSVTEDLGVVGGNLSVGGAVTITDTDTGEASFDTNTLAFGTTTAIGGAQLGAVAVNADGTYTYTVSNAAVQYLKAGETIIETYTVQSLDGTGTSTITITIHGVNDVPAVTDDAQSVTEDLGVVGGNLSVGGAVTITDTDTGEASFDTNTLAFGTTTAIGGAQLGAVAVNADGTYTYTVSNAAVQYLKAGETIIETYTVQSLDGTGTSTITITIHGVNDVPAVTDDAQSVTEDLGVVGGNLSVGGAVTITDTDTGEASFDTNTLAFGTTTAIGGAQLGAVAVNADGTYTYTVSNAAVQYLKAGETIIETYTVQSLDGTGTSTITITIHGVNDVPAVTDDAQSVTEDLGVVGGNLSVGGAVTITDTDTGEASFDTNTLAFGTTTAIGGAQLGAVAVNADGTYTYTVSNAAVQYLKAGETIIETYTVQSLDGTGTSTITITIHGVNDVPAVTDDAQSVTEDLGVVGGNLSVGGAVTITDTDTGEASFDTNTLAFGTTTAIGGAQLGAVAVNADGTYTYTVSNAAVQYLKAGETIIETYTVQSLDGTGTSTITITIHGANEAPVDGDESVTIPQDTTTNGNVLLNASDADGGTLSVEQFTVAGQTYAAGQTAVIAGVGSLSIQADGSYVFIPEKNYTGRVPVATYIVSDGQGGTDTSTLSIVVTPVTPPNPKPDPVVPVTPDMSVHFEYPPPEPPQVQIPSRISDVEYVHQAVIASQNEQWMLTELGADKLLLSVADPSVEAKSIDSPDNIRFVEHAVRASQQVSKIWSLKAQGLEVNLPVQPPQPFEVNPWAKEASKPEQKQTTTTSQTQLDMDAYWVSAWDAPLESSVDSSGSATFSMQLRELARNASAATI